MLPLAKLPIKVGFWVRFWHWLGTLDSEADEETDKVEVWIYGSICYSLPRIWIQLMQYSVNKSDLVSRPQDLGFADRLISLKNL